MIAVENHMVVDWWWAPMEREPEPEEDDRIVMIHADGTPVYEDDERITYCDIYECSDCPRCGDDCDGEWEDDDDD